MKWLAVAAVVVAIAAIVIGQVHSGGEAGSGSGSASASTESGSSAGATAGDAFAPTHAPSGSTSQGATPRPELPAPAKPGAYVPPAPIDQQFASQARDERWAPHAEAELRRRLGQIRGVSIEATDCRTTLCKLVVVGPSASAGKAMDDLRKLDGFASGVMLSAPQPRSDGQLALVGYARFGERDAPSP